jgi:hypothetical protein
LGFWVPKTTFLWFQEIAQRPQDLSELHWKDKNFGRSSCFLHDFFELLKRNKTGAERGELMTLQDEPYLAILFDYLPSPPSAPAVGAMSVVVTGAYIAAVVELSLTCLCSSQLCYIVKSQYHDVYTPSQ